VRSTTHAAVGDDTVAALRVLRTEVAFVGTNGLSVGHGLSTPDHAEAAAKRAMIASAHQVVVLVDSSKIGQEHMVRFADITDVDVVITDSGITDADRAGIERQDVEVVVA
jgi:DeoR family fructose operon transcriptional repressor